MAAWCPHEDVLARGTLTREGGEGPWGQRAALHCGGRALNAPTALRCSVLRPHRGTRCVRFALYAQTAAMSMITNALRAGRKPCVPQRHRGAPRAVPMDLRRRAVGARGPASPGPDIPNTSGDRKSNHPSPDTAPAAILKTRTQSSALRAPSLCRCAERTADLILRCGWSAVHQVPLLPRGLTDCRGEVKEEPAGRGHERRQLVSPLGSPTTAPIP